MRAARRPDRSRHTGSPSAPRLRMPAHRYTALASNLSPMFPSTGEPEAGSTLRASLDAAREELRTDIARGAGGRAALERHSDRVDGLLRQLFADTMGAEGPVAIVALGGYGRRHLCLQSDIDLLLLFGGRIGGHQ